MNRVKLVYGVGVNDANHPVTGYEVIGGKGKTAWRCPIHLTWANMLIRCYSAMEHKRRPAYKGCSVTPDWRHLSVFRAWMVAQDWEGKQLDKDLLVPGNKVYGPDTCVFVSRQLNNFMNGRGAARGTWPIGVNWNKCSGKFQSSCRNPFIGKLEHLGYFACPAEAHETWRARKHEHACTYADQQTDPRIAQALRTRYAQTEA